MVRSVENFIVVIVLAAVAITTPGLPASASSARVQLSPTNVAVEVKLRDETVPPGGTAQIQLEVTDAKPISTVKAFLSFSGLTRIDGINLVSPTDDAVGIAVVRGTDIEFAVVSPNATFGTNPDYPLLTVAGRVAEDAPIGAIFDMVIDAGSLRLFDASGVLYSTIVEPGELVIAPGPTIHAVTPGSATLPAGSVVTINGNNFKPRTEVRFKNTKLAQVRYVSPTRLDVVLARLAHMHGTEIEAKNPDGTHATYFSYQRTTRSGTSVHQVLRDVVPLFRNRTAQTATLTSCSEPKSIPDGIVLRLSGAATGIALQNPDRVDAPVVAELFTASGVPVACAVVTVPSNHYVVRELSEIFGVPYSETSIVSLTSVTPIQVLGVSIDKNDAATPQIPM